MDVLAAVRTVGTSELVIILLLAVSSGKVITVAVLSMRVTKDCGGFVLLTMMVLSVFWMKALIKHEI